LTPNSYILHPCINSCHVDHSNKADGRAVQCAVVCCQPTMLRKQQEQYANLPTRPVVAVPAPDQVSLLYSIVYSTTTNLCLHQPPQEEQEEGGPPLEAEEPPPVLPPVLQPILPPAPPLSLLEALPLQGCSPVASVIDTPCASPCLPMSELPAQGNALDLLRNKTRAPAAMSHKSPHSFLQDIHERQAQIPSTMWERCAGQRVCVWPTTGTSMSST
jgi:hypothetical protein